MKHVLVVDDKEENVYYLEALLTGNGYIVDSARHGAEALVKARLSPPDIIISDLLMPVMDGYTLLRHWKIDTHLKHVPFIVYTATYTEPEDEKLALSMGADAFILKPSEPEDFLARLHEIERNATAIAPSPPKNPTGDEAALLKVYSETLIRKLEEKTLQLEESNRTLQGDIAERRRVEALLMESQQRLVLATEAARIGIWEWDITGNRMTWDARMCALYGITAQDSARTVQAWQKYVHPEDRARFGSEIAEVLEGARGFHLEFRVVWPSGEVRHIEAHGTEQRGQEGATRRMIGVNWDITERKKLETQFLRVQRMESIGTLAGGIAHDLNNVLTPILMSVEILGEKITDSAGRDLLSTLKTSALHGADLVQQVLTFARGVGGRRVVVNPIRLLKDIQKIIRDTFPKNIHFTFAASPDLWTLMGDPTQLHQVFTNLCVNARDAMPHGGSLSFTLENIVLDEVYAGANPDSKPGEYIMVKVADTGAGMPPAIRDKIFEPFFTTKEIGKGTGLGLSTTMAIVKSHGGFIDLYSEVGKGTIFKIYLPANSALKAAETVAPERSAPPRGNGEVVLLVEDEEGIRKITQRTLERFGYRVLLAVNGAEAVALYAQHRRDIAVVLTDMAMPIMDGPALAIALKAMNPHVKIIGCSGMASNVDVSKALAAGVAHFIQKPYTADAIMSILSETLEERVQSDP